MASIGEGPEAEFERYRAAGDVAAFRRVFDDLSPRLLTLAGRHARNAADAEDLVQATFLKALQHRDSWDAGRPLLPWLAGILVHRAQDLRRRGGVRSTVPLLGEDSLADISCDPQLIASLEDDRSAVLTAVGQLGEPYSELFSLRIEKGLNNQDLAKALSRPEGTVRVQLARGRERLEALLPKELRLAGLMLVQRDTILERLRVDVVGQSLQAGRVASMPSGLAVGGSFLLSPAWLAVVVLILGLGLWIGFSPEAPHDAAPQAADVLAIAGDPEGAGGVNGGEPVAKAKQSARIPLHASTAKPQASTVSVLEGVDVTGSAISFDGSPIAGADIYRFDPLEPFAAHWLGRTGEDGQFSIFDVTPEVELYARAAGHQPPGGRGSSSKHRVRGAAGSSHQVNFRFGARGHSIEGRVLGPDGQPAPFAYLVIGVEEDARDEADGLAPLSAADVQESIASGDVRDTDSFVLRADAEGAFRTDEVPRGTVSFFARSVDHPALVGFATLDVFGKGVAHVSLHLRRGAEVYGHVLDSQGHPRSGVALEAEWKGTPLLGGFENGFGEAAMLVRATTKADGAYSLVGLLPGKTGLRHLLGNANAPREERVDIRAGQRFEWNPVIPVHTEIRVRGIDGVGEPLVGWEVRCEYDASAIQDRGALILDAEGRARFTGLRGGEETVTLHPPGALGGRDVSVPARYRIVTPSDEEVVLSFDSTRACAVAGTIERPAEASEGFGSCKIQLVHGDFEDCGFRRVSFGEHFEFKNLPAGAYRLQVSARDAGIPRDLTIATFLLENGQSLELGEVEPEQGTTLVLDVVLPPGVVIGDRALELKRASKTGRLRMSTNRAFSLRRDAPDGPFRSEPLANGLYVVTYNDEELAIQSRLIDVRSSTREQREPWELGPGHPVQWAIHFDRQPATAELRQNCGPDEGKVNLMLWDESWNLLWDSRPTQALEGTEARVMTVSQKLLPGAYRLRVQDERFDGWDKPLTVFDFQVPTGGEAQYEVHLREGR